VPHLGLDPYFARYFSFSSRLIFAPAARSAFFAAFTSPQGLPLVHF